MKSFVV